MATATLRSQDALRTRFNKHRPSPISILPHPHRRQKRCSVSDQPRSPMVIKHPAQNNLVMGQVRILKRGEEVPSSLIKTGGTSEILRMQIEVRSGQPDAPEFYSGCSFFESPSPSAVPVPRYLANGVLSLPEFLEMDGSEIAV